MSVQHDSPGVGFDNPGDQYVGTFNQVGHDQHLYQQRESFLREIAATKTRARWLVRTGVILVVVGVVTSVAAFAGVDFSSRNSIPGFSLLFGGLAVGVVGQLVLIFGIVLHIVSTARRRRVDNSPLYTPRSGRRTRDERARNDVS